jgi:uroporphyrinogen decarboxylase
LVIYIKGAHDSLDMLTAIGFDVVGLDWTVDPVRAREVTRGRVTLQGNADPALLYGGKDVIRKEVKIMLEKFGPTRHIANLGEFEDG